MVILALLFYIGSVTGTGEDACCQSEDASCFACRFGMTIEELCIEFPHYDGCATDSVSMTFYSQRACAEEPIDQPCSGDHPNCTFEDCMAHCVNEENCKFFFRKNDGNCFLYPSCDETSWKRGFTFKLTRGSDAEFSSSPSRIPSSIPSHSPTDVSNAPSINPSRLLSSFPSSNPTRTPTSNPSRPPASAVREVQLGAVLADDIPQYFTPKIDGVYSNQDFPLGLLSRCTEPLADGVPDLRGLYQSDSDLLSVEQCGDRLQINSPEVLHDFPHADGTLENGLDDVRGHCACQKDPDDSYCRIRISAEVVGNCFELKLNALTTTVKWCKLNDGRVSRWTLRRTTYFDPIEQINAAIPTCSRSAGSKRARRENGGTLGTNFEVPSLVEDVVPTNELVFKLILNGFAFVGFMAITYGLYSGFCSKKQYVEINEGSEI